MLCPTGGPHSKTTHYPPLSRLNSSSAVRQLASTCTTTAYPERWHGLPIVRHLASTCTTTAYPERCTGMGSLLSLYDLKLTLTYWCRRRVVAPIVTVSYILHAHCPLVLLVVVVLTVVFWRFSQVAVIPIRHSQPGEFTSSLVSLPTAR
jgi:hypothetical protein